MLSLRHPKTIIASAAIIFLLSAIGLPRLELMTDGQALIPGNSEELQVNKDLQLRFGIKDRIMVVIETDDPDGIFNLNTFLLVNRFSDDFKKIHGIDPRRVVSLTTLQQRPGQRNFHKYPHFIDFNILQHNFSKLRDLTYEMEFLRGFLVSVDGEYDSGKDQWSPSSTIIYLGINDRKDAPKLIKKIEEVIAIKGDDEHRISITGSPVAETSLGIHVLEDLAYLIPFSIIAMALLFWVRYRSMYAVLLPLSEVLLCLVFVFGLMGYVGVPVYLTITVMPVILTALGVSDEIHVLNCYSRLINSETGQSDKKQIITETFRIMSRRIILTSITTSIGFAAFIFSPVEPVKYFGLFTAIGILFCMIWTIFVIPALLLYIPGSAFRKKSFLPFLTSTSWIGNSAIWALNRKSIVWIGSVVFLLFATFLTTKVEVWDSWKTGFAEKSETRVVMNRVNKLFHGSHRLLINIYPEEDIPSVEFFEKIKEFEEFLTQQLSDGQGGVYSFTSQLAFLNYVLHQKQDGSNRLGNSPLENEEILKYYEMVLGSELLNEQLHKSTSSALIQVILRDPNYSSVSDLLARIETYQQENYLKLLFGGDIALSQAMIKGIVDTQLKSIFLSLSVIFLLALIYYRSFRYAIVSILAPSIAILTLFAIMGAFRIPLGVATSMFASILIGVGVDFSIHLIESYRNKDHIHEALEEVGPAYILDTLVISIAFGLMIFSQIPSNSRLGLFIVAGYAMCLIVTVVVVPVLVKPKKDRVSFKQGTGA